VLAFYERRNYILIVETEIFKGKSISVLLRLNLKLKIYFALQWMKKTLIFEINLSL